MSMPTDQENSPAGIPLATPAQPVADDRQAVRVDDSKTSSCYANFCRVTGTPEEIIMDFGLNPQPFGAQAEPIAVAERIICNYYTAKRFLAALHMTVQRHEAAFGVLETDVQKRVQRTQR